MTEIEIREALISRLAESRTGEGAVFISEMFLDGFTRRADLVMANGKLSVFEIKSDRDSLRRLDGQIDCYIRFFEQVTVVCADKHLSGVLASTPDEVGVWVFKKCGTLKKVRPAKTQFQPSCANWLSFLPVDEIKAFLRQQGMRVAGNRADLVAVAGSAPVLTIREYVLSYLKRREFRIQCLVSKRKKKLVQNTSHAISPECLEAMVRIAPINTTAIPRLKNYHSSSSCSSS